MFTETQLKARELKLDIAATKVNQRYKFVKVNYVKCAEKMVYEIDLVGHAKDEELSKLEEMLWKITKLKQ